MTYFENIAQVGLRLVANQKTRRLLIALGLLVALMQGLIWLMPLRDPPPLELVAASDLAAREALIELRNDAISLAIIHYTPFVDLRYIALRNTTLAKNVIFGTARLRWDNLIFAIGGGLLGLLVIRKLGPSLVELASSDLTGFRGESLTLTVAQGDRQAMKRGRPISQSAEGLLAADVDRAIILASSLYSRSTLLLGGGIVMSFVGIGVFWASLPTFPPDKSYSVSTYLPLTIRPLGMLLFVEAIAWFLLRQYRALIEDYKSFHRMYLRRINFLVALKLAAEPQPTASQMSVAAALLIDDLSGRLKKDETTEGLEIVKQLEPNLIVELVSAAIKGGLDLKRPLTPKSRD